MPINDRCDEFPHRKSEQSNSRALLTALAAVGRTYLSSGAGFVAAATGWTAFFAICALAALPGLVLLAWLQARGHFSALDKKN